MRSPSPEPPRYLTAAQTRRVYDRIGRIQGLQAVYEHRAIEALLAYADFAHAHAVCELGHGTGALAGRLLRDQLPSDARYSGIDVSPHMHELATRRLNAYADRVELRLGNALPHLPYPDASLDRFLATYVLDLLSPDDITRTLAEARRVLAPGGLLCLASLTTGTTRPLPPPHPRLANPLVNQAGPCRRLPPDHHHQPPRPNRLDGPPPPDDHHARHHLRRRRRGRAPVTSAAG